MSIVVDLEVLKCIGKKIHGLYLRNHLSCWFRSNIPYSSIGVVVCLVPIFHICTEHKEWTWNENCHEPADSRRVSVYILYILSSCGSRNRYVSQNPSSGHVFAMKYRNFFTFESSIWLFYPAILFSQHSSLRRCRVEEKSLNFPQNCYCSYKCIWQGNVLLILLHTPYISYSVQFWAGQSCYLPLGVSCYPVLTHFSPALGVRLLFSREIFMKTENSALHEIWRSL